MALIWPFAQLRPVLFDGMNHHRQGTSE